MEFGLDWEDTVILEGSRLEESKHMDILWDSRTLELIKKIVKI